MNDTGLCSGRFPFDVSQCDMECTVHKHLMHRQTSVTLSISDRYESLLDTNMEKKNTALK